MAERWEKATGGARGYFAIGAESLSKPFNLGNLIRSAHAFGASFVFTVNAPYAVRTPSDTSRAPAHLPLFNWDGVADMRLPEGCRLVGVELLDTAADLPSFRHPRQAAYVLGPERGRLSSEMLEKCDHVVRIPTAFCINVAMAGAVLMYDRVKTLGRFAPRPVSEGASGEPLPEHVHGAVKTRKK